MKGKGLSTGTKIAIFMLVISIIVMLVLLNYSSKLKRAKVNNIKETTTTTIPKIDGPTNNIDDNKIITKSFKASLADVLYGKSLIDNYKIETYYSGARFNFNCTKYSDNKCVSGSALLDTGKAVLPLYTYDKEEDNYYNHLSDYYIIINDEYIILTYNHAGKKAGKIKIYDTEGNKLSEINNVVTGYMSAGQLEDQLYPNLVDGKLIYYVCNNNQVYSNKVSIKNPGIVISKNHIPSVKCF